MASSKLNCKFYFILLTISTLSLFVYMISMAPDVYSSYVVISKWGSYGMANGQFDALFSAIVDSSGNVFVVDTGNHRIQKFTNNGTFVTKWGLEGTADGQFSSPVDIDVDTSGNIFVVDNDNFRIQKFVENTILPTVTITNPSNGSTFIVPATETINVRATDNLRIKQVELYMNDKLSGNDMSYPYSITLTISLWVYTS